MGKARRASDAAKIGKRISVKINSSLKNETITGRLLAVESTDGSLVLSDAERERRTKSSNSLQRSYLGFVVIRGSQILSISSGGGLLEGGTTSNNNSNSSTSILGGADHLDTNLVSSNTTNRNNNSNSNTTNQQQTTINNQGKASSTKIDYSKMMKGTGKN